MNFWDNLGNHLQKGGNAVLLIVVESIGSSPGRQGFKMFVSDNGMQGSIGGGFMEHKLVELAKTHLLNGKFRPYLKRQIHQSNIPKERSGMICSGEQTICFVFLNDSNSHLIQSFASCENFQITANGISINNEAINSQFEFLNSNSGWVYKENLKFNNSIYIIGGGHVGLALSKIMCELGFFVTVFDERGELNTMQENSFADEQKIVDYKELRELIPEGNKSYVVLVSFGYRTDKICIQQLASKKLKYFGVMGSQEKMKQLMNELKSEGFSKKDLDKIHSPIGVKIGSKTPSEIAISIAAQIIQVKNS